MHRHGDWNANAVLAVAGRQHERGWEEALQHCNSPEVAESIARSTAAEG